MADVHKMFYIAVILPLLVGINGEVVEWNTACTKQCNCQLSPIIDLSMIEWIVKHDKGSKLQDDNSEVRTVTCTVGRNVDLNELFQQIPTDTQVLVLLETPESPKSTLLKRHIDALQHLIAIEIQGYNRQHVYAKYNLHKTNNNLYLDSFKYSFRIDCDTFINNEKLKYISLSHVSLISDPQKIEQPEEELQEMFDRRKRSVSEPLRELHTPLRQQNEISDVLIEMKSPVEIVPYEEYVKATKKGKLQTFANMTNLEFIQLHHSDIRDFNYELLDNLSDLRYILIEHSDLLSLPDFAFYGAPNITHLSLAYNKILDIRSEIFAGLLKLEYLNLKGNNISHLSELSLPPFPSLHLLDLRENTLVDIFPNSFELLNTTKVLYLGDIKSSTEFKTGVFVGLISLETLFISNLTTNIFRQDILTGTPSLKNLAIQGSMPQIEYDAFLLASHLNKLILKNCSIEKLSMDTFMGLEKLLLLDLSYNHLNALPPGVFGPLASLQELHLDHNQLTVLPSNIFDGLPCKMIRVDFNPWHCDCNMLNWQATVTNKVRYTHITKCVKPITQCKDQADERYMYDETVVPKCLTPSEIKGKTVYEAKKLLGCKKTSPLQLKQEKSKDNINLIHSFPYLRRNESLPQIKEKSLSKKAQKWYKLSQQH